MRRFEYGELRNITHKHLTITLLAATWRVFGQDGRAEGIPTQADVNTDRSKIPETDFFTEGRSQEVLRARDHKVAELGGDGWEWFAIDGNAWLFRREIE
jgi:hypothetical protein